MSLDPLIDRLAALEPSGIPVVSLYLDARPDEHGRERATSFVRREPPDRLRSYPRRTPERQSLERDRERIDAYVRDELRPSANGLALFACDGAELFEAVQLDAPIEESQAIVSDQPQLYPLARLNDAEGMAPEQAKVAVAEDLVTKARRTSAALRFIEDPDLLAEFGGVGAFLRYRVPSPEDRAGTARER